MGAPAASGAATGPAETGGAEERFFSGTAGWVILAIIVALFRKRQTIRVDELDALKN